ncbi:tRNA-dihydrouridine synthase [Erysiphe neolycopersici]|uniref:tRNA-dihydrouridine(16/17) synthase [NAD(P)(+)] n=1 Tax=Erysiphe neolycopersici TaxID=212602 RepID=A0A420HPU4_9PEZI|nr:tRNA-dihydrouridine synthase [Erysiphe neolycopersici]
MIWSALLLSFSTNLAKSSHCPKLWCVWSRTERRIVRFASGRNFCLDMNVAGVNGSIASLKPSCQLLDVSAGNPTSLRHPLKPHGRVFYERIGSPKFVLAPMVDQSEFAWRLLTRSFLSSSSSCSLLTYTPMLHARLFAESPKFRDAHFQPLRTSLTSHSPVPNAAPYLDGNPKLDRPLFVQFCANNPNELIAAAKYVSPFCDAIDLNLGCPQGIAKKGKYGAFLQEDQELIFSLINILHEKLEIPVTAKIRILDTKEKTLAYAQNVLKAGASIITVHGRTREMKGHKTGLADWNVIRYLRENLPSDTVLFANGNILKNEDIALCLEATGADAVMSAEGNLHDPAIFASPPNIGEEGREYWRGKDGIGGWRVDAIFRRYMDIIYTYVLEVSPPERKPLYLPSDLESDIQLVGMRNGKRLKDLEAEELVREKKKQKGGKAEKSTNPNLLAMQPHLFHLLRALVSRHHHVRDALARCKAGDITSFENVLQMVENEVKDGLKQYEMTQSKSWIEEMEQDKRLKSGYPLSKIQEKHERSLIEENSGTNIVERNEFENLEDSSVETVKACIRPWWVAQPYVRPLPKEALAKGSWALSKREMKAAAQL